MSSPAAQPPHFRIAGPADVDALVRLINAAFSVEKFFIEDDRINAEGVRRLMATGQFLLAPNDAGAGLGGCVYVEPRADRAYLGLLSVHPARQRSGLGKRLMDAAEAHARDAGARYMDLRIVDLRQELPEFYQRLGYIVTGTAPFSNDIVTKRPCHFINMSKALVPA